MKKNLLVTTLLLSLSPFASAAETVTSESITAAEVKSVQSSDTYTYVRCWYRPHYNHNDPATDWEWALNDDGSYYKLPGYWYSSVSFKNMFYTDRSQDEIKTRCDKTLDVNHEAADITYFASDNRFSYNHSIWTNDSSYQAPVINKIISIGDSISDTGNMFNASQWRFPNSNSWFLGHFSNGLVWTEYLAKKHDLPLYNWAVGGAAGETKYLALSGVNDQIDSYLVYMKMAKNYQPKNSLFTLEIGLNDFVNYDRSVADVSADFSAAMKTLTENGAQNILVLNLPDATKAPQFKYSDPADALKIKQKIETFNLFIAQQVNYYAVQGVNISLFDTYTLFNDAIQNPDKYGFKNTTDACLDINRSNSIDYLLSHSLTNDCAADGADSYVFWGITHPSTQTHKVMAEEITRLSLSGFSFK
ncbi:SGNH/GDSL hydrolase family protein [Psychromonas ossibalaenae]|uniref:SGNH/GDSL hydrolase family protein n=1 Tax=Psychromonas ossibalaenae TaxID=444922 RepID=UPI000361198B|nr:SGNH/GDSL hydrolase family protein [Psychromonas ossibalaenae]